MLHLVQVKLHQIEAKDVEELSALSQDEAVRLALLLAANPAPPMPEFEINSKYKDSEELADLIDDIFKNIDDKDSGTSSKYSYSYGSSSKDKDYDESKDTTVTDAEAEKQCTEWKDKYSVVMGVSWGNLPYDLQQKWLHYSCDYHLSDNYMASKTGKGDSSSSSSTSSESMDDEFEKSSSSADSPSDPSATPGPTEDKDDFFI